MIEINWFAVVTAMIVGMAIAGFWYSKLGFGGQWRKLTGVSKKDSENAGKMPLATLFVANFITALVLDGCISIAFHYFNSHSVSNALLTGLLLWLAFSATTLMAHNGFELKPKQLTALNNSYQLVLFLGMSLVISLF